MKHFSGNVFKFGECMLEGEVISESLSFLCSFANSENDAICNGLLLFLQLCFQRYMGRLEAVQVLF